MFCLFAFSLFYSDKPTNAAPLDLPEDDLPPLDKNKSASPIVKAFEGPCSVRM